MKHAVTAMALTAGVSMMGCSSTGLSPREVPGRTQSAYLHALYDVPGATASSSSAQPLGPPRPLRLPTGVAVVQVGEVAPPQTMIDALRKEPAVFARVESLPGTETFNAHTDYTRDGANRVVARPSLAGLRRMAADVGMDYVLLVGGTIDHASAGTPLSLLDITIVGGFIVPSRETRATAKASAALVDVKSGRVVVSSSAEAKRSSLVPAASVAAERPKLLEALRDDVVGKLGTQVLVDAKNRAALRDSTTLSLPAEAAHEVQPPDGLRYDTTRSGI